MTRPALSRPSRPPRWLRAGFALWAGTVSFGSGYGTAQAADSAAAGVLVAAVLTGAAGWFGPPLLQRLGAAVPADARSRTERAALLPQE
jgi:hypothetical protein